MLVCGFVFTIPCFFLLWAGVVFLRRRAWSLAKKKTVAAGWAAVLCAAIFSAFFMSWPPDFHFAIFYMSPLIAAVFFFRWPGQGPVEAERLAEAG